MQMRAAAAKLRILEVPVDYGLREGGSSKVAGSLRGTLRAGYRIVATFFRVWGETRRRRMKPDLVPRASSPQLDGAKSGRDARDT
jgi:hypothetical protein